MFLLPRLGAVSVGHFSIFNDAYIRNYAFFLPLKLLFTLKELYLSFLI